MEKLNPIETASDQESGLTPTSKKKRVIGLSSALLIILVIVVLWFCYWFFVTRFEVKTSDAYIHGDVTTVSSEVAAPVIAIHVRNSDLVEEGQLLVQLDPSDALAKLEKAKASLAQAVRRYRQFHSKVEQAGEAIVLRQTQLRQATSNFQNRYNLLSSGALPKEEIELYKTQMEEAVSNARLAHLNLNEARSEIEGTTVETHPLVEEAKAAVMVAYLNWRHTNIYSPVTGFVAERDVLPGDLVGPGRMLMTIVPLDNVWVEANFKETQLTKMGVGQPVKVHADIYGSSVTYHGTVEGITPGTGASFSLLPAQNATGNWIKVTQRVPVIIKLRKDELKEHPLLIGLSMNVNVDVAQKALLLPLIPSTHTEQTTSIYSTQVSEAEEIIQKIIHENSGKGQLVWAYEED